MRIPSAVVLLTGVAAVLGPESSSAQEQQHSPPRTVPVRQAIHAPVTLVLLDTTPDVSPEKVDRSELENG